MNSGFLTGIRKRILRIKNDIWRWLRIRDADVLLIPYPKCGRTWLRLMIGKFIQEYYGLRETKAILELGKPLARHHSDIPDIFVVHEDNPHFKTPHELSTSKKRYHDKKVIFLVRNPRDVFVSNYFHQKKREIFFDGSIEDFYHRNRGSIDSIMRYFLVWSVEKESNEEFWMVKYENLHRRPKQELPRVLRFVGFDEIPDSLINNAINYASFSNMKEMEKKGKFESDRLRPGTKGDGSSYKVREGKIGGYADYLPEKLLEKINEKVRRHLSDIPYYSEYIHEKWH